MPARHRSRQRALQVLFQWDSRRQPVEEAIRSFYETLYSAEADEPPAQDEFMESLAKGAAAAAPRLDARISAKAEHWKLDRMPIVDRNILRLAVYEMTELGTPPAIAIDEALELARQFSSEESIAFINGVLDAVNKEILRT
jgi:N utilization substance protein B